MAIWSSIYAQLSAHFDVLYQWIKNPEGGGERSGTLFYETSEHRSFSMVASLQCVTGAVRCKKTGALYIKK